MRSMTLVLTAPAVVALALAFGCSSDSGSGIPLGPIGTGNTGNTGATGATGAGASTNGGTSNPGMGGKPLIGTSQGGTAGLSSGAGAGGVEECVGAKSTATAQPPVLEFLIDTSGSMDEDAPNSTLTKWEVTRDALIQSFTDMAENTGTGLIFYPNTGGGKGGGGMCINKQVAIALAPLTAGTRQQIITRLEDMEPNGSTPTHDALEFAYQTVEATAVPGPKHVVLVTDGAPTYSLGCTGNGKGNVDAGPIIQAAEAALQRGVKTFVIGSPGSEDAAAALSQTASRGGTARPGCSDTGPNYCHFDMTAAPDLSAALNAAFKEITSTIVSCNYPIPPAPAGQELDPAKVNVNFTNSTGAITPILRDPSATDCNQGWQYASNNSQIILCPDTCTMIKADPMAKVDVVLGCKTIIAPPR